MRTFVGEVLDYYKVEIQQLTVNAIMRLAIFEWAFRMEGVVPDAAPFAATHKACARKQDSPLGKEYVSMYGTISFIPRVETEVPTKAYWEHWGPNFLSKWFYYRVGPKSNLWSTHSKVFYIPTPEVTLDDTSSSRVILLKTIARKLSMHDLCEEFIAAGISTLSRGWFTRDLERDPTTRELRLKSLDESGTLFEG